MTQSESTSKKLFEIKTRITEVYIGKSGIVLKINSGLVSFHEQVPDLVKCLPALAKAVNERTKFSLFFEYGDPDVVGLSIPNASGKTSVGKTSTK